MKYILGKKLGMTTVYDEERGALNVTLIECMPNKVSFIRTKEKDGYEAIQVEIKKTTKRKTKKELFFFCLLQSLIFCLIFSFPSFCFLPPSRSGAFTLQRR